jgi:hypothetical protein
MDMTKRMSVAAVVCAAVFMALVFSGCNTAPTAPVASAVPAVPAASAAPAPGAVGFPLIDIVDAEVEIANDSRFAEDDAQWVRSANTRIIGGTLGSKIIARDLTINLVGATIQVPIRNGADISEWFLNMPLGLKATAHALDAEARYAADKGDTRVIVTIDGTPEQTINQPIKIRVPYEVTNRSWDFHIPVNEDRRFEVYGVDVASVVVGGAVNRDIDSKTFRIRFGGTKLAETLTQDRDISSWFTNLPRGLRVVVAEETLPVSEGQQILTVSISGRPAVQMNEKMLMRIPANITTANIVLEVPASEKAMYDIGSYSSTPAEDVELRTGTNWKGTISGWGLTGPEVYRMKDFTAVGIIQIQAESEYAMGVDGEYHWRGETITYGDLMAEARDLAAHAIIDVVIDSQDQVNETIERRHIEAGHIPSGLEAIKLGKGIIVQEEDLNGGYIYVEKITVIKRTWTGTALAIQYAPAYEPVIGDGGSTGYVPAVPDFVPVME